MVSDETLVRSSCSHENTSKRFIFNSKTAFGHQYFFSYCTRLNLCRQRLNDVAITRWGPNVHFSVLADLEEDRTCVVFGTFFKYQALKPNVLKEVSDEGEIEPEPIRQKYTAAADFIVIEDELQRVVVTGNVDHQMLVTGLPVVLLGHETESGKFFIDEIGYLKLNLPYARPSLNDDRYIAFISGLNISGKLDDRRQLLAMELFIDWITGKSGSKHEQAKVAKIARLVIAGNSLSEKSQDRTFLTQAKYLTRKLKVLSTTINAVDSLDSFVAQLTPYIEVDIMAGEFDAVNYLLPQQPLHRCCFPLSSKFQTFHSVTNPYEFNVEGIRLLGTSGQNVSDIYRFSSLEDRVDIMQKTLEWGHLCPTAPDTLGVFSYREYDPFILEDLPNIYFAGNQPDARHKVFKPSEEHEVLLLTIPAFSETPSCVLVNLKNFNVETISFACDLTDVLETSEGNNEFFTALIAAMHEQPSDVHGPRSINMAACLATEDKKLKALLLNKQTTLAAKEKLMADTYSYLFEETDANLTQELGLIAIVDAPVGCCKPPASRICGVQSDEGRLRLEKTWLVLVEDHALVLGVAVANTSTNKAIAFIRPTLLWCDSEDGFSSTNSACEVFSLPQFNQFGCAFVGPLELLRPGASACILCKTDKPQSFSGELCVIFQWAVTNWSVDPTHSVCLIHPNIAGDSVASLACDDGDERWTQHYEEVARLSFDMLQIPVLSLRFSSRDAFGIDPRRLLLVLSMVQCHVPLKLCNAALGNSSVCSGASSNVSPSLFPALSVMLTKDKMLRFCKPLGCFVALSEHFPTCRVSVTSSDDSEALLLHVWAVSETTLLQFLSHVVLPLLLSEELFTVQQLGFDYSTDMAHSSSRYQKVNEVLKRLLILQKSLVTEILSSTDANGLTSGETFRKLRTKLLAKELLNFADSLSVE